MQQGAGLRKDARENRDNLIQAAKEAMSEHGVDVPLEVISEKAGTTRGTLYRNFADRTELYRAVLESELRSVTDSISENDGCGLFEVMRKLIEVSDLYHAFTTTMRGEPASTDRKPIEELLKTVVAPHLATAKRQSIIRADLTEAEVLLACRMVAMGWRLDGEAAKADAIDKRLLLVIRGMAADPKFNSK